MMVWTDERMDDLAERVDVGFARVDDDIRGLRVEMQDGFKDVRSEMQYGLGRVHDEVAELRSMMFRFGIATIATMGGLIATWMAAIVTGTFVS